MAFELVIHGGGKMGEALLGGLLRSGWAPPETLAVVEPVAARGEELAARYPSVTIADRQLDSARGVVIAVKPSDVDAACRAAGDAGCDRLLSIAAGVPTPSLEAAVGGVSGKVAVIRAMPNTAALVGAGAAAIAPGADAGADDLAWAESILAAVGSVVRVPEHLLDAVTGLSGSGPAYVFLMAEALIDAGVLVGLPRDTAVALTTQLLVGSAKLLAETGSTAEALRAAVTSPGGTTAAGLRALERAAVRAAFADAVVAATDRSRQLGQ